MSKDDKYDENMDAECIPICDAIKNSIVGDRAMNSAVNIVLKDLSLNMKYIR